MSIKRILITGTDSYIGTSFEKYILQWPKEYQIDSLDMKDKNWREKSFSGYDVVYHVAGIAHSDNGKISDEKARLYYKVNTELTLEVAKKAKREGVRQFIFMSSAIVYGGSAPIGKQKVIKIDTPEEPSNAYGNSKLQAEKGIRPLEDENFKVVILRPPMIYGKGSKGNYPILSRLAKRMIIFPYVENQRSMLYIGNLVTFVKLMIDYEETGTFWPQNKEYVNTSKLVKEIAQVSGKNIYLIKGMGWLLKFLSRFTQIVNKAFGSLTYDQSMSMYKIDYQCTSLKESIIETER